MTPTPMHSVVVPLFNEELVVPALLSRLHAALRDLREPYEIIAVDDGSRDTTFDLLAAAASQDSRLRVVRLSRNFGHQTAITAGIDHASGETVTVIDADLQDPPELIPLMIEEWRRGADVVFAVRESRQGETRFKKYSASLFYRLLSRIARVDIPLDSGDFRLMGRRAADALCGMRETNRYVRGLVGWIGMRRSFVPYTRESRLAGDTKYPLPKMVRLAADGIISFSIRPLQIATYMGLVSSVLAFGYATYVFLLKVFTDTAVEGWSSLMVVVLFLGGVQLTTIGIVGEYIGRIYEEVRGRPLYLTQETVGLGTHGTGRADITNASGE